MTNFGVTSELYIAVAWTALVLTVLSTSESISKGWISFLYGLFFGICLIALQFKGKVDILLNPDICLSVFCPIFVLKLMHDVDSFIFTKSLNQIFLVVVAGFLTSVSAIGFTIVYVNHLPLTAASIVTVGVIFSLYDIPRILLELDHVKNIGVICDGEAVITTALSMVVVEIMAGVGIGFVDQWYHICALLVRYICLALVVGYCFGNVFALMCKYFVDDSTSAIVTTAANSYITFVLCEYVFFCSGIIGVMLASFYVSKARIGFSVEMDIDVKICITHFYEIVHEIMIIISIIYIAQFLWQYFLFVQVVVAVCAYILGRSIRTFIFLGLTPILSRTGYGYDFPSFITTISATRTGLIAFAEAAMLTKLGIFGDFHIEIYIFVYTFLSHILNGMIFKRIFSRYRLLQLSNARQMNISAGLTLLINKQVKVITHLKMNRFYSDANWPLINECTRLANPFISEHDLDDNEGFGIRQMTCTSCSKKIFVEPTKKELMDMSTDAHYRVLKAIRISLIKQHEKGMLTSREVKLLVQAVETALDTDDLFIRLDGLYKLFNVSNVTEQFKTFLIKMQATEILSKPEQPFRRKCYNLFNNYYFKLFFYAVIVLQIVVAIGGIAGVLDQQLLWTIILNIVIDLLCVCEVIIKVIGYSSTTYKQGFKQYIKNVWNMFDFITLSINVIFSIINILALIFVFPYALQIIIKLGRLSRIIRVFKFLELFGNIYPKFVVFCEKKIETKIAFAFTIGVAIVVAYEDVIEQLVQMVDTPLIRDRIKARLENDKIKVVEYVSLIVRRRPWVAVKVETTQAVMGVLKQVQHGIAELKISGQADDYEYEKLNFALEQRRKNLAFSKYDQFIPPKQIFSEIPWLYGDDATINFLYETVSTKIWNAGDLVCQVGEVVEGIYIIVSGSGKNNLLGVFKITYIPTAKYLRRLENEGLLPVKDFLLNDRFTEEQTEYVITGNSLGELSVLTGRESSCEIVAHTPSQAFIIPIKCLWDAIERSMDPVNGLAPRMWKYLSNIFARRMLMKTPSYHALSEEGVNYILDRAIVPELGAYKSIVICDLVEDMLLIEGLLVDSNTREIYKGPCYVPRTVQNVLLPKYSGIIFHEITHTRLMIVPLRNVDKYELMMRIEQQSDTLKFASSRLLVTNNKVIEQKYKRRANLKTKMKMSSYTSTQTLVSTSSSLQRRL